MAKFDVTRIEEAANASATERVRFWSRVEVRGADECWPWTGKTNSDDYALFSVSGRPLPRLR